MSWFALALAKSVYPHRSTWASRFVIPFHVMATVSQNLGCFHWPNENQESILKEQNYNWALRKTGFGNMYKLYYNSDLNDILHDYLTCVAPDFHLRSKQTFSDIKLSDVAESHLNLPR